MTSKNNLQKGSGVMVAIIVLLALIVLLLGYFAITKKSEAPDLSDNIIAPIENVEVAEEDDSLPTNSHCGLTVTYPVAGSTVNFPFIAIASVNNTNMQALGCSWTTFEAAAGPVRVMSGITEVGMGVLSTTEFWMTANSVNYLGEITLTSDVPPGTPLTLVFEEDNPSGEGTPDTLSIPIIAQ
jgi:hypothetical protein